MISLSIIPIIFLRFPYFYCMCIGVWPSYIAVHHVQRMLEEARGESVIDPGAMLEMVVYQHVAAGNRV